MSNLQNQPSSSSTKMQHVSTKSLQYLKFQLHPNTYAMLPIQQITEVLKIQLAKIMPIPQMPPWIMGVYNWRGDILWMLDLGQLLGLDSWYHHQHNGIFVTAIVLSPERDTQSANQIHLGLVVAGVDNLETCDPAVIQGGISSQINPRLDKFLQGYWLQSSQEMVLALDAWAIASAMPNYSH